MDTNSPIFTLFSMTASALLLNSNCGIRGARQAQLAATGGGQARARGHGGMGRGPSVRKWSIGPRQEGFD